MSSSSSSGSDSEQRVNAVKDSIAELQRSNNFKFLDILGKGTYGDVLKIHDKQCAINKAAKIVILDNFSETELLVWSSLDHENIIRAEMAKMLRDGTLIIIMPLQFKSLDQVIAEDGFSASSRSFSYAKRWIYEVLQGVDYMHRNRFCHLDIKLDNVLISHDGRAVICDFSFANYSSQHLNEDDVGVPAVYRPPELFQKRKNRVLVGRSVDEWSFGILVTESLTQESLLDGVRVHKSWKRDIKPILKLILSQTVFEAVVRAAFPRYNFEDDEIANTLDFIDGFLRIEPSKRCTTSVALRHRFLKDIETVMVNLDEIYSRDEIERDFKSTESREDQPQQLVKKRKDAARPQVRKMMKRMTSLQMKKRAIRAGSITDFKSFNPSAPNHISRFKASKKSQSRCEKFRRQLREMTHAQTTPIEKSSSNVYQALRNANASVTARVGSGEDHLRPLAGLPEVTNSQHETKAKNCTGVENAQDIGKNAD